MSRNLIFMSFLLKKLSVYLKLQLNLELTCLFTKFNINI
jgi:hypothetical protein